MNNLKIEKFNYKKIFSNLSLEIEESSFTAILGNNNSGKTTLAKLLAGYIIRQETIMIGNKYINYQDTKTLSQTVTSVIEGLNIPFSKKTVQKELATTLEQLGLTKALITGRLKKIYNDFELSDYKKENPNTLSKYNTTKLLLANAIAPKPKVLVLDNVLRMLSKEEKDIIIGILKKYQQEEKTTIIFITSLPEETTKMDKLLILHNGKIAHEGNPLSLLSQDKLMNTLNFKVPFMVDLSIKLKFYDLLQDIEIDMERMIDTLWKSE